MPVHLTNRQRRFPVDGARLARQAQACLDHLGLGKAELSLLLVNDRAMRALNRDFRGVNGATDVLSFPLEAGGIERIRARMARAAPGEAALGDVVISVERARAQAARAGVKPAAELSLLLVHGILHLVGMDHEAGPRAAARMARAEREALAALKVPAAGLVEREGGTTGTGASSSVGPRGRPRAGAPSGAGSRRRRPSTRRSTRPCWRRWRRSSSPPTWGCPPPCA